MTHRGPFQPLLFCDSVKATVPKGRAPGRSCASPGQLSCTNTRTELPTLDPPGKGPDHTHRGHAGAGARPSPLKPAQKSDF